MAEEPRFLVDLNVGRLAKWLRAMGYDAVFVPGAGDSELVRLAQAQRRVLLTKDTSLLRRRVVTSGQLRVLLVRGDYILDQLRHVVRELRLDAPRDFSRCLECNVPLAFLAREVARGRVPTYVFATQEEFQECPTCGKVYWRGTHWANMKRDLARVRSGTE
ncbi:MAG: Mut7-C RNAse domain-containing protein [Chloroflexi bacterium]|nr:Mut7-C RNAse domain-containing protein [Chloroflexota bacterium]